MAGEVGHIVYGVEVLGSLQKPLESPAFWAGTLFPDIGHIGAISRHRTHPESVTYATLMAPADFTTGLRVHAWLDTTREVYLRTQNMKERLFWHPFVPHALKLVEDEVLYNAFADWNLIQRSLNTIYPEEKQYVHDESVIQRWHTILQTYFKASPTDGSRHELSTSIGLSDSAATELNTVVKRLREDNDAHELIEGFARHLSQSLR